MGPVLAVEALSSEGWCKYAHSVIGMRTFGHSGPAKEVQKLFGFTAENVQAKALERGYCLLMLHSPGPRRLATCVFPLVFLLTCTWVRVCSGVQGVCPCQEGRI